MKIQVISRVNYPVDIVNDKGESLVIPPKAKRIVGNISLDKLPKEKLFVKVLEV